VRKVLQKRDVAGDDLHVFAARACADRQRIHCAWMVDV
jgi:hypothetical protein